MKELPTKRVASLLATVLVIAVATVGCGSDGDDSVATGDKAYDPAASTTISIVSIPKAQFIKQANRFCREAWPQVRDNWDSYIRTQNRQMSEEKRFENAVVSLLSGIDFYIFDEIMRLGSPIGENEKIEEIIGPFQIAVELGWKKRWRAHSVPELAMQFNLYNQRARQYGLDDCVVNRSHLGHLEA